MDGVMLGLLIPMGAFFAFSLIYCAIFVAHIIREEF